MSTPAMLHFFCGKMAAGKSTLARQLAARHDALLLSEDDWLGGLFPGQINAVADYAKHSKQLRSILGPHVQQLLARGTEVVLDFPGNTPAQRVWFRSIFEPVNAPHTLHFIDLTDAQCLRQLRQRHTGQAAGSAFTSAAAFASVTRYFSPPAGDEDFNVVRYNDTQDRIPN